MCAEEALVIPQQRDFDISMLPRLPTEEKIEGPPSCDPPWPREVGKQLGHLVRRERNDWELAIRRIYRLGRGHSRALAQAAVAARE